MRRVITISLNNNAYQVEEDGFEALSRYLEDAARALAANPDGGEIMADLEQAIADKCQLALGTGQSVVSAGQMASILREMGPVDAVEGPASRQSPDLHPGGKTQGRTRLYRIPQGQLLAGVCMGLSARLRLDVTWVRVAFAVLAIFSAGVMVLIYIALAVVMPRADTPEQLAAAHGLAFSAREVIDGPRHVAGLRAPRRPPMQHAWHEHRAAGYSPSPGPAARIAGGLILPVLTVVSAALFAAALVAGTLVWQGSWHPGSASFVPWSIATLPLWIPLVALLVLYLVLALPLAAGRRTALVYANGGRRHGWANGWSALLWLAVVVLLLIGAWLALAPLQEFTHQLWHWPLPVWHPQWI